MTKFRQLCPHLFKEAFPNCCCIINCTEVKCEHPSNVEQQVQMWSNYKSSFTIKFLIAIAPCGLITFLSQAYGGRATDSFITVDSGLLKLLEPNDVVLANKGFPQIFEDSARQRAYFL
jgi:hypothetical protein